MAFSFTADPGYMPGRHGAVSERVPARELLQATSFSAKVTAPDWAWLAEHWGRWHDRPYHRPRYALPDRYRIHKGKKCELRCERIRGTRDYRCREYRC